MKELLNFTSFASDILVPWFIAVYFKVTFNLSWLGATVIMFSVMLFMFIVFAAMSIYFGVKDKRAKEERERIAAEKLAKSREIIKEIDETLDRIIEKQQH